MKEIYEKPVAEKITFSYREQVVAASGVSCKDKYVNEGQGSCQSAPEYVETLVNG